MGQSRELGWGRVSGLQKPGAAQRAGSLFSSAIHSQPNCGSALRVGTPGHGGLRQTAEESADVSQWE
nr:unnamed protein product [Rangifer tarandus platyrhynchus]